MLENVDTSISAHADRVTTRRGRFQQFTPVWAEVESRIDMEGTFPPSWFALLVIAGLIGAVGILANSQILIVGAMVVGAEYGAILSLAFGVTRRDPDRVRRSAAALAVGFPVHVLTVNALGLHLLDYLQFTDPALVVPVHDRAAASADRNRLAGQSDRDCVSTARFGSQPGRSAVIPARITGRERPPGPSFRIVFLPVEQQHVIAQQDQRVRAGARSGGMAVVVHVPGRHQGRHIAMNKGTLVREAQLGPAASMADRIPPLMGLHPADRGDAHPATVRMGVAHHSFRTVDKHQPGTSFRPDQPLAAG